MLSVARRCGHVEEVWYPEEYRDGTNGVDEDTKLFLAAVAERLCVTCQAREDWDFILHRKGRDIEQTKQMVRKDG